MYIPTSCSSSARCRVALRELFGWRARDYWFPDVRSSGGAIAMFMFVLFPLRLYACPHRLPRTGRWHARSRPLAGSRTVGLLRPGVAPAGTSRNRRRHRAGAHGNTGRLWHRGVFRVQTFTTGIYRAWFSLGDRVAAAQLSAALLSFVVVVLTLEHLSRGRARFNNTSRQQRPHGEHRLPPLTGALATFACFMPLLSVFCCPPACWCTWRSPKAMLISVPASSSLRATASSSPR